MSEEVRVTVTGEENYRFTVEFGPGVAAIAADEPPPIGEGSGPSPQQLLAAPGIALRPASFLPCASSKGILAR